MSDGITQRRGWIKAKASGGNGGNCVEVNFDDLNTAGVVRLRDSKHPDVAPFTFSRGEWGAFLDGAGKGEFNI